MRTRNNLTDEQKKEIDTWILRRKDCPFLTVPILADWSGYNQFYIYAVENYTYPMNDRTRKAYKKAITVFRRHSKSRQVAKKKAITKGYK